MGRGGEEGEQRERQGEAEQGGKGDAARGRGGAEDTAGEEETENGTSTHADVRGLGTSFASSFGAMPRL